MKENIVKKATAYVAYFIRSACSDSFDVASVMNGVNNSEKVIQLSADKTDDAKVITFKEKIITKNAA